MSPIVARMELRHLRYFLAVADARHFGRAARRLAVSQPTLSQQVKQLEDELGTTLLERGRAGVRLTAAGEAFRGHASRALEDVAAGERAVGALAGLTGGPLRVGYQPSMRGLVVPAIARVLRKYPGLVVTAYEGTSRRVEHRVADGALDVGVAYAPTRAPEVTGEPLHDSRLGVLVGPRHALASHEKVTLSQLAAEPLALLSPGLRARATVDAFFASARFSPRVVLESNAVATVLAMVRAGLAITVLPEPAFADAERLPVLQLSPAPRSQLTVLVWRTRAPRSAAAQAFADELHARVAASS